MEKSVELLLRGEIRSIETDLDEIKGLFAKLVTGPEDADTWDEMDCCAGSILSSADRIERVTENEHARVRRQRRLADATQHP